MYVASDLADVIAVTIGDSSGALRLYSPKVVHPLHRLQTEFMASIASSIDPTPVVGAFYSIYELSCRVVACMVNQHPKNRKKTAETARDLFLVFETAHHFQIESQLRNSADKTRQIEPSIMYMVFLQNDFGGLIPVSCLQSVCSESRESHPTTEPRRCRKSNAKSCFFLI